MDGKNEIDLAYVPSFYAVRNGKDIIPGTLCVQTKRSFRSICATFIFVHTQSCLNLATIKGNLYSIPYRYFDGRKHQIYKEKCHKNNENKSSCFIFQNVACLKSRIS